MSGWGRRMRIAEANGFGYGMEDKNDGKMKIMIQLSAKIHAMINRRQRSNLASSLH